MVYWWTSVGGMIVTGKRVLVVGGAGTGIGREITRRVGAGGGNVVVADLDGASAREAAAEVSATGGTAFAIEADVRRSEDVQAMVSVAADQMDGLDVLVTVVGGQVAFVPAVPFHEMTDEDWDTIYEVNLRYVARSVRATLRVLRDQGTGGSIVAVGSVVGLMAAPHQAAYGVMKAGLASLARTISAEYATERIRMNVVACGAIATAAAGVADADEPVPEIPMGRYGLVSDVAGAVLFLASDTSSYMTGQQLVVDGGVSVRGPFDRGS